MKRKREMKQALRIFKEKDNHKSIKKILGKQKGL
jgi:hypothetical protein